MRLPFSVRRIAVTQKIRHKNIPFFIPHSGCKNNCVFCSQRKITGFYLPPGEMHEEAARLVETVEEALKYMGGATAQIAFFGGSFTGIERERMLLLLQTAYHYVENGSITGIRLSTRPDYIDDEILDILEHYGVTDIELGLQSTDESVLKASGRGHGREICFQSAEKIVKRGFSLGGQMMIGLPCSTPEKEIKTAEDIVSMHASEARIYPTVVFTGTALYNMAVNGTYVPITNEEAVIRSAECCKIFQNAGVEILRIGLHSSDELKEAPFGANHPAIGELVYSKLEYDRICSLIGDAETKGKVLILHVPSDKISAAAGHRGCNKKMLYEKYGFSKISIYKAENNRTEVNIKAED